MTTVFTNARIFDGSGSEPFEGEVRVEGDRITQLAAGSGQVSREGADVVDATGKTLLPGLIEAHAHISWPSAVDRPIPTMELPVEEHLLITARNARVLLDAGFTSAYSAGSLGPRFEIALREEINGGWLPGPRLRASCIERAPEGDTAVPDVHDADDHRHGPEAVREFVRKWAANGVDTIKFLLSSDDAFVPGGSRQLLYTDEEVKAAGEQARESGVWLACHAHAAGSIKQAVNNGFRIIYHCTHADEEALDLLEEAKDRVFVAPAVGVIYTGAYEAQHFGVTQDVAAEKGLLATLERWSKVIPEMRRRGIRVLPGGDYGFLWNPNGANARDLQYFVELYGFSPAEALRAATMYGGQLMGLGDELGLVREGYLADLLLVDGDPLEDIALLRDRDRITHIMQGGRFHKRPQREEFERLFESADQISAA
ncbi:amidohydrolase family protein [Streptomyces hawaiiensis]|uniref:amidohydrolase family protein n=1 Tax=Streptomyces hawaiiensis TaxID=67305 RepID=UPI0031D831F7